MNGIANYGDRRMTVREMAESMECNPETIKGHIRELFPDLMKNGVTTYLSEAQVTVILEKMKQGQDHNSHVSSGDLEAYKSRVAGIETALTPTLKLEMLYRQIDEIKTAEIKRLKDENQALQIRMDESEQWQTVKRYVREHGYSRTISEMNLIGRELSRMSRESGYEVRKAADANCGEVNVYHVDVLREYFEGSL